MIAAKRRCAPTAIRRNQLEITWRNLLEELPNFSFFDKDYALNVFNSMVVMKTLKIILRTKKRCNRKTCCSYILK